MLSKYIGEMHVSGFAQIGLVLFFAAFVAVLGWVSFVFKPSAAAEQSRIPLEDDGETIERREHKN